MFKKRKGFGLDSIIIFISIIVIIGILVLVSNVFLKNLADVFVPLTTTMPKFDPTGNYANPVGDTTKSILGVYNMLRSGIIWALAALLMVAGILFMLEQIEVVPASTTYGILSKGILYFFILFAFPPIWDLYATGIETGSRAIIDPHHTGQTPDSVLLVFTEIQGGITHDKPATIDNSIVSGLVQMTSGGNDLGTIFSDKIKSTLLGFIGSLMALMAAFMTYMFGTIRQVLTAVLITGLPVILILSLIPWFQGVTKRLLDTLFGISIVPIFSSLVMVTGAAYLGSITTHSVEEQWFAALAVLSLSTFMPTILVPILGSLFSSMTQMASSGVGFGSAGTMMAIQGGKGIGSGAYGAAMSAQHGAAEYGQSISGVGMVKAAMGGGLAGGFGGLAQGLSNVGSHALRRVGAKDLAYDMRDAGSQIMKTSQDVAHQYGNSVIQPVVDNALAENSAGVMTRLATIPVPEEQREAHMQNGTTILNLAHDSIETGNYAKILDHQYFKSIPVRDTQSFAKAVSATIVNHGFEPQKLANISYNLEKMGGLTSDNVKDFIQNYEAKKSSHAADESQTFNENAQRT
ncbi:MAG: hypothetical protein KGI05_04655 [Thaumarchaeota archaeon]|nr:hypothetical protein [Nitrososphaerota archaeon]